MQPKRTRTGRIIRNILVATTVWMLFAAGGPRLLAQQPNADELVRRGDEAVRGKTEEGILTMTVRTPDWQRTLELRYWAVNPDKTFIRVTGPAKEAGTATLRLGSNMWNYLPSVERTIKIPPSLMLESWMGSDFTNDDLVRESSLVKDYDHRMDGEANEGGDACYRITATAKPEAPVVWTRIVLYVRKSDAIPRREEYYDSKGKVQKILTFDEIRKTSGKLYPMRWKMVSATKSGHETVLQFTKLTLDRPISNSIFTQENLRQPF
ncbi:MAG: outer membrane lipoprotein-sorting protein [Candidatus Acidiferrum sp.]